MKKLIPIFLVLSIFSGCSFSMQTSDKPLSTAGDKALDQKFYDQGVKTNDFSQCNQILDKAMKDECARIVNAGKITAEAVTKVDITLCKKIDLERYATACEAQVQPLIDAKISNDNRMQIEKQAYDQKNYKLCDQIKDENQKVSCKYNIISDLVISKKDPSLCNAIGPKDIVDKCKSLTK